MNLLKGGLSSTNLLFTNFEQGPLRSFCNDAQMTNVSEVDLDGVIKRIKRVGDVNAVFVMDIGSLKRDYDFGDIASLLEICWEEDVCFISTRTEANMYFANILSTHGMASNQMERTPEQNEVMKKILLTRYPDFDAPITEKQHNRWIQINKWNPQQVRTWIEHNYLAFLSSLFEGDVIPTEDEIIFKREIYEIEEEDNNGELQIIEKEGNKVSLAGASFSEAVKYLCCGIDSPIREIWDYNKFRRDFLICHSIFTTPIELLEEFRLLYNSEPPKLSNDEDYDEEDYDLRYQPTVIGVIRDWILMEYAADFDDNPELNAYFLDFVQNDISVDYPDDAYELISLYEIGIGLKPPYPVDDAKLSKAPKTMKNNKKLIRGQETFLSFPPVEVARQMTLLDEDLFHRVRMKEFLGGAWAEDNAMELAPNLTTFINHTNRISQWIITEILKPSDMHTQVQMITHFIRIARELNDLRNYSGLMCILTALQSAAIERLSEAWSYVNQKDIRDFKMLCDNFNVLGHYKNYRRALNELPASVPCIPIIVVTCSDLNGLGEVLKNKTEEGYINFIKHSKFSHHIWGVKRFMRARYIFHSSTIIQQYIKNAETWEGDSTLAAIATLRNKGANAQNNELSTKKVSKRASSARLSVQYSPKFSQMAKNPELTERDWQVLGTGATRLEFDPEDCILKEGDINRHLFRIVSGICRVDKEIEGNLVTVAIMEEGSMFGEISMLLRGEQGKATAWIIADTDVVINRYNSEFVLNVCASEPSISIKLNKILALKLAARLKSFHSKKKPEKKKESSWSDSLGSPSFENKQSSTSISKKKSKKSSSGVFDLDSEFSKLFGIEDEIVIKTFICNNKGQGVLYLTQKYLCYYSSTFARKNVIKLKMDRISEVSLFKEKKIEVTSKKKSYYFKDFENINEALQLITSVLRNNKANDEILGDDDHFDMFDDETEEQFGLLPSRTDWDEILRGTRREKYVAGDIIIEQGASSRPRIFHISIGTCRIEKTTEDGKTIVLGTITTEDPIFGEISFLEGATGRTTASVVADSEDTRIDILEGFFLDILFNYDPGMAGRFYHYLAYILSNRLSDREAAAREARIAKKARPDPPPNTTKPLNSSSGGKSRKSKRKRKRLKQDEERMESSESQSET
eukprot:TRINITY_DN6464_c0_g1_i1.p1 TRINITY_DN6464_c0_g1~~TRINITY_DN6464_c0_g1_i1.p1  ORF type:complete len:1172 (+),score=302.35 TRINITY_DN6464_c0_g1_i1:87-3518(+)